MIGGDSESVPVLTQPPAKPWEISSQITNLTSSTNSKNFSPPLPPPPIPSSSTADTFAGTPPNSGNWFGSGTGNYYGGNYSRFGYPSNYNSYSSPYYMNNTTFGGINPPAPGSYLTSSLENTTRPLFDTVNHILQAINHVACFVDSTVFAVWTSVTAAGSIITMIKNIKNVHLRKWCESVSLFIKKAKMIMKTSSGRKRILILISIVASVPVLLKALHALLKMDSDDETSLIPSSGIDKNLTSSIDSKVLFARANYAYEPIDKDVYLTLKPGDVVLISKEDEFKLNSQDPVWIAGKLKNGSAGYFPSNYVTVIK